MWGKIGILLFLSLFAVSCYECREEVQRTVYAPVYMSRDSLNLSIQKLQPRPLKRVGAFIEDNQKLYIVELGEGIHIFQNENPTTPQPISFIQVPGISSLAIKNNTLLVNQLSDLVSIEVSDPMNPIIADRLEGVFEDALPPLPANAFYLRPSPSRGVVVSWKTSTQKEFQECY